MTDQTAGQNAGPTAGQTAEPTIGQDVAPATTPRARTARGGGPAAARAKVSAQREARQAAALAQAVAALPPLATPAIVQKRHRGLLWAFVLVVVLPVLASGAYLWGFAQDQYASTVGFTVRREEASSATDILGGLTRITGSGGSVETDILYEFIRSQEIVTAIDERIALADLYSQNWPDDPVFALWPEPTTEDLRDHWERMVRISYDSVTQLIELRVLAYSPEDAQLVAQEILAESQKMINNLNQAARENAMRFADEDVEKTIARLKVAREALSRFRTRTQIVDPAADIQGRMGVLANLQQQLAEALIENDIVLGTTLDNDPRREQTARRIEVIRDRIASERATFATTEGGAGGDNYPELLAEFERLTVDLQYAEETYRLALAAQDSAREQVARQTVYLAPYIRPTLPQTAEYPQRAILTGMIALFLTFIWAIGALIYYSVRDRH